MHPGDVQVDRRSVTRSAFLFGMVAILGWPRAATAGDPPLQALLSDLSHKGRWEQILVATDSLQPLPAGCQPYRERAERESQNLAAFLRLRNAVKRKDYGTALVVANQIGPDSVYAERARGYLESARARFGADTVKSARRHPTRALLVLNLGLAVAPNDATIKRELKGLGHALRRASRRAVLDALASANREAQGASAHIQRDKPSAPRPAHGDAKAVLATGSAESISIDDLDLEPSTEPSAPDVVELDSKTAELYSQADSAMDRIDTEHAAELFAAVVERQPRFAPAQLRLGLARYANRDLRGASVAFSAYLDLMPDDPRAAKLHEFIAQQKLGEATDLPPRQAAEDLLKEAHRALSAGNTEGAVTWLVRASEKDPTFAEPYLQLGLIQERSGHRDLARDAYQTYLSLEPDGGYAEAVRATLERLNSVTRSDVF